MTIQGAIEDLNNLINAKDIPVYYKPSLEKIKETIELEYQKTGHWIEIDDYPHEDFECDCCGGKVYGTEEPYEEYKYCPNCGAKMKGE